jgi:uncharacterized membrane protein
MDYKDYSGLKQRLQPLSFATDYGSIRAINIDDADEVAKVVVQWFYRRVCERAEANMTATGTVAGAHWNAMRQVMAEMGIEES